MQRFLIEKRKDGSLLQKVRRVRWSFVANGTSTDAQQTRQLHWTEPLNQSICFFFPMSSLTNCRLNRTITIDSTLNSLFTFVTTRFFKKEIARQTVHTSRIQSLSIGLVWSNVKLNVEQRCAAAFPSQPTIFSSKTNTQIYGRINNQALVWWTNLFICRIGKGSSSNRKRADEIFNEECPAQIDSLKEKMHSPSVACR